MMRCDPGGTSTRNVQRSPSEAIAQYLERLCDRENQRAGDEDRVGTGAAPRSFRQHREEHGGIDDLHRRVDVAGGLDRAERAQRAIVA